MPGKFDPRLFEEAAEIEADNARLRQTVADLEARLRKREGEAKKLAEALMAIRGTTRPELFLIILAVVIAGRMALHVYAENGGVESQVSSGVFGAVAVAMFRYWTMAEWKASRWLMIPKTVLLVVAFMIAAAVFSNGMVWKGVMGAPGGNPGRAFALAEGALLLAALPLCGWLLNFILNLLTEPLETVKGMFGR